ncbi:hypothetical protein [Niastella populi]|uniref:hypothetical protein n=1 Tax=Niastella populi TaxID=550983 RepID=UPI0009BD4217|nr:hypothetical protein [Niastella populi]
MSRQSSSILKNKSFTKSRPARVISMLHAGGKKAKNRSDKKSTGELPLYNHERIFRAKKHDPL